MGASDVVTSPVTDEYVDENGNTVIVGYPDNETRSEVVEPVEPAIPVFGETRPVPPDEPI